MKALIDLRTSHVLQVEAEEFPVASPLLWVEAPEGITVHHTYVEGQFAAPPEPEPEPPPAWVYPFQARKALLAHDLLDAANDAVANAGPEVQIAWEYAIEIHRNDPLIEALGAAIGLTSEQIDALFIEARGY